MLNRRELLAGALAWPAFGAGRQWLLGANTALRGYGMYQAIDLIRKLEFPVIEIHPMGRMEPTPEVFPGFRFDELPAGERTKLRAALRPFQRITTHLPYTGLNWMGKDPAERHKAVRTIDTALEGSAYLGARMAVLHPQSLKDEAWKPRESEYIEAIRRWGDQAKKLGVKIAVETGFPPSVKDFVGLVQAVNHPSVGATIDVGHQGRFAELVAKVQPEDRGKPASVELYNATTLEIVTRLGAKIFHVHVHDIDPATWVEHKPMVHGFVDYPRLFSTLRKVGYEGVLVLEIGGDPAQMPEYLHKARELFQRWLAA